MLISFNFTRILSNTNQLCVTKTTKDTEENMVKYFATAALTLTTCVGAYYFLNDIPEQRLEHSIEQDNHSHAPVNNRENELIVRNGKVLSSGKNMLNTKNSKKPEKSITNSDKLPELDSIIWLESEESKTALKNSGTLPPDLAEEAYIEVDLNELNAVELGDSLDLYIPQLGGSYNGQVDHISNHPNGDRTVEAFIPGAGTLYSAVITIGENAIYGNIATQEDVFILEGIGKYAWLAPKSAMIANHQERTPSYQPSSSSEQTQTDAFELDQSSSPTTTRKNN